MLGEKLGEYTGKMIGVRVLGTDGHHHNHGPRMEVTIQQTGSILGVEGNDIGTYESCLQTGGHMTGKGQGITTTKDGEIITWTATGIGRPTGKGNAANWRGSIQYQTTSTKLAKLNGTCCIFEHDVDEKGEGKSRVYEWR